MLVGFFEQVFFIVIIVILSFDSPQYFSTYIPKKSEVKKNWR